MGDLKFKWLKFNEIYRFEIFTDYLCPVDIVYVNIMKVCTIRKVSYSLLLHYALTKYNECN